MFLFLVRHLGFPGGEGGRRGGGGAVQVRTLGVRCFAILLLTRFLQHRTS